MIYYHLLNNNQQMLKYNTKIDYNNLLNERNEYYRIIYEKKLLNIDELITKMNLLNNDIFNDDIRRDILIIYKKNYLEKIKKNTITMPYPLLYLDMNRSELILNYKVFTMEMIRYYNELVKIEFEFNQKYESIQKLLLQIYN